MKKISLKQILPYVIPLILLAAAILWLSAAAGNVTAASHREELEQVRKNIEKRITMCYAIEGAYPESTDYLLENYGVDYNADKYIVHYEYIADNIRPNLTVIERVG